MLYFSRGSETESLDAQALKEGLDILPSSIPAAKWWSCRRTSPASTPGRGPDSVRVAVLRRQAHRRHAGHRHPPPMTDGQIKQMFGDVPGSLIRVHDWREGVTSARSAEVVRGFRQHRGLRLASTAESAAVGGRPRPDPVDRPGGAARSDRHGQLQQEHLRRHGRARTGSTRAISSVPRTAWSG